MEQLYIGIDMGGTKCAVVAGHADGKILRRIAFPSGKDAHPDEFLPRFYEAIDALLREYNGGAAPAAVGVSCGGPLDTRRGVIQAPPNLPLWDEVPICALLSERYGCPAYLQNDANACAIAEWRFGAGRGTRNMVFLTFGTGLGAQRLRQLRAEGGDAGFWPRRTSTARSGRQAPASAAASRASAAAEACAGWSAQRLRQLRAEGRDAGFWPRACIGEQASKQPRTSLPDPRRRTTGRADHRGKRGVSWHGPIPSSSLICSTRTTDCHRQHLQGGGAGFGRAWGGDCRKRWRRAAVCRYSSRAV